MFNLRLQGCAAKAVRYFSYFEYSYEKKFKNLFSKKNLVSGWEKFCQNNKRYRLIRVSTRLTCTLLGVFYR